MKQKFLAAMFDFDGTLTERKPKSPVPESLQKTLENLSRTVPMALCTARPFKSAYLRMVMAFGDKFKKMNWVMTTENGCAGYEFDARTKKWIEFYRVKWPEKLVSKKMFSEKVYKNMRKYIGDYETAFQLNGSSIIFQPHYENSSNEEIARRCDVLEAGIKKILRGFKNGGALKVINSKLGVIIIPKIADKDRGIEEFGKYLRKKCGRKFSAKYREIIAVGDQPGKNGNDHMFLKGRVGTPFTVGEILKSKYPLGIYKGKKRLTGPTATEYLLKSVKFC